MKSVVAQLVLVVILALAGVVLWTMGAAEQRLAAAQRTLVTLRYEQAAAELENSPATNAAERVIADATGLAGEAAATRRTAAYWLGDLDQFLRADTDEVAMKMLAADASYRALRAEGGTWQSVTTRLDAIAKRYADVLREQPENEDAAYNYEFVVRLRTAVAAARRSIAPLALEDTGLTVHGHRGAPPEGSDTKKFKMIVPMRPDERMEAEQAGRGAQKIRKG